MSGGSQDKDPAYVRAVVEAAGWRSRLTDHGMQSSAAFEDWLADDPLHQQAWAETQSTWHFIGEVSAFPEMVDARHAALARARHHRRTPQTIVPAWIRRKIPAPRARRDSTSPDRYNAPRRQLIGMAATALVLAIGGGGIWWENRPDTYRTQLGERRVIPLADGSKVSLDSNSLLVVRYSAHRRDLMLLAGQARFDVAHDASRPFVVTARDRTITATGTDFNVDLVGKNMLVTLIEGRVLVRPAGQRTPVSEAAGAPAIVLNPGQQLTALPAAKPRVQSISLDRTSAWESGQLIFDNEPIEDVVARVSHYTTARVSADPDTHGVKISGVFKTGDLKTFLDAVTSYLPIDVVSTPDGGAVLHRRTRS